MENENQKHRVQRRRTHLKQGVIAGCFWTCLFYYCHGINVVVELLLFVLFLGLCVISVCCPISSKEYDG